MKRNWKPIQARAAEAAKKLGHETLDKFKGKGGGVRTAMCQACYGCCWVSWTPYDPANEYRAGGRILNYRCGTKEAAGVR